MKTRQRITGLAMLGMIWLSWVMIGFSTGGVVGAVARAFYPPALRGPVD